MKTSTRATRGAAQPTFPSLNPASGETFAAFPVMDEEDVRAIVATARAAAPWWASRTFAQRKRVLLRWAAEIAARSDELADLLHVEQGKPVGDAHVLEIVPALEQIRWAATHARRVLRRREVAPSLLTANYQAMVAYEPYGVVAHIGPWNYPVFTPTGSLAYALAAGNTVVFKPSEHTPAIGTFLVDTFGDANPDVPVGVLSLVTGDGRTGALLCGEDINKIAFTGSPGTARAIMRQAADRLIPVLLECGGKDAMVVLRDADLGAAAKEAAWGGMTNAGQTCVGIERVYVDSSVEDRFLALLTAELDGVRAGSEAHSPIGPMTVPGQIDIVRRHVDDALARGGTAVVGGTSSFRDAYIDPIVLTGVEESADAVREETFGPTLTVASFDTEDEAVQLVNASRFALGASVFSRSRGMQLAQRLNAGMVSINSALAFVGIPSLPFGGRGESGIGRTHGADGLREFARTKSYARLRFALPGLDVSTLHRSHRTDALIRTVVRLRHR